MDLVSSNDFVNGRAIFNGYQLCNKDATADAISYLKWECHQVSQVVSFATLIVLVKL
jgi:hypothetical protein